jgi:predicted small lipoprotein YifL
MSGVFQILVSAFAALLLVTGCGQKGPLYLPSGEAAAGRASLPETLAPSTAVRPAQAASGPGAATPPSGTAAPVRNP